MEQCLYVQCFIALHQKRMNSLDLYGRKVNIFNSEADLLDYIADKKAILVAINAEKIANPNPQVKDIINAHIGYLDGIGPVLAARHKGHPHACKIPGCELWLKIAERFRSSHSFYLLGSTKDVVQECVGRLKKDFPGINIVGFHDGFLTTEALKKDVVNDIIACKPDIVFVAMGSPKQELFMAELHALYPALYMGLGGSFDLYTGKIKRAPKWWVDHYMEFAYRFIEQPKRIKRLNNYFRFFWLMVTNKL